MTRVAYGQNHSNRQARQGLESLVGKHRQELADLVNAAASDINGHQAFGVVTEELDGNTHRVKDR